MASQLLFEAFFQFVLCFHGFSHICFEFLRHCQQILFSLGAFLQAHIPCFFGLSKSPLRGRSASSPPMFLLFLSDLGILGGWISTVLWNFDCLHLFPDPLPSILSCLSPNISTKWYLSLIFPSLASRSVGGSSQSSVSSRTSRGPL